MIASVSGRVIARALDHVVVEAAGVGYHLSVSSNTLGDVPDGGHEITLHSHLVVREDAMNLYGFSSVEERELFLLLISVSGVGPKVALSVLSSGSPRELQNALASADSARFQTVPGIGKRTAERLVVELKDRIAPTTADMITVTRSTDARSLAREGLVGLGYNEREADAMLDRAVGETPEDLIATALKGAAA